MHDDSAFFKIEENPIISASQAIIAVEVRQSLDVSAEPALIAPLPAHLWMTSPD